MALDFNSLTKSAEERRDKQYQNNNVSENSVVETVPEELDVSLEEQWASEIAFEELIKTEQPKEKKKSRAALGRDNQVKIRLTDGELKTFKARVKKSGLSQGDYLRNAALNGQIVVPETNDIVVGLLDEITLLRAEIGRQGGLLKMIIKPEEGYRNMRPSEWNELIQCIRQMEETKKKLTDLEGKIYGYYNSPHK